MMCGDRWLTTGSPWEGDEMTEREQFERQENWKKIHAALEGYAALASHMNDEVCQSYCKEWQRALEAVKIAEEEENRVANLEQAARATPALPQAPLSGAQTADIVMAGLIHVGYTNPLQIGYGKESEGAFYSDTKNNCVIPLYMLKTHEHRLGYHSDAPAPQALPQGLGEWIADNWWCPIHNDEECDCGTGFVPADALEHYLSGMAIVPVEPTDEMVDAACDVWGAFRVDFLRAWDAALAAAKEKGE